MRRKCCSCHAGGILPRHPNCLSPNCLRCSRWFIFTRKFISPDSSIIKMRTFAEVRVKVNYWKECLYQSLSESSHCSVLHRPKQFCESVLFLGLKAWLLQLPRCTEWIKHSKEVLVPFKTFVYSFICHLDFNPRIFLTQRFISNKLQPVLDSSLNVCSLKPFNIFSLAKSLLVSLVRT